jgi:beta-ketodecanoyl-[acyl-carrier-protein] synthase
MTGELAAQHPGSSRIAKILGTGVFMPTETISNGELSDSFNSYVASENTLRQMQGETVLERSNADFILEASGIQTRHVLDKSGVLDPARMMPSLPERLDDALSVQAEFAVKSARPALADAGLEAADIDLVICSCAHHQRPYPAIAIEIQKALGCKGAAFDMNVACSSTTFAMHVGAQMVQSGAVRNVLVCSPEIMSGHLNFRDRKTHFIFGDASAAVIIGSAGVSRTPIYSVVNSEVWTEFSSNIRSNFGFLNRTATTTAQTLSAHIDDKLVTQVGNKVFKDIVFAASNFMRSFLARNEISLGQIDRFWLHQANLKLIRSLMRHLAGDELATRVPIVLDRIGNVASPGSLIAFHETRTEIPLGGFGIICSFGAGYSIGCLLLQRVS